MCDVNFLFNACNRNIRYDNNYSISIHTLLYPTSTPSAISSPNLIRLYVIDVLSIISECDEDRIVQARILYSASNMEVGIQGQRELANLNSLRQRNA